MSLQDAAVIDVHAHAVLEETMGAAGSFGPTLTDTDDGPLFRISDYLLRNVRYRGSAFMDPQVRLAAMDSSGIDYQLLSPNPLTYFHYIPAPEAIQFCRIHNDALAEVVAGNPARFGGLAALPMQDIDAACAELRRSVEELGMLGAMIGSDFPGGLDSEAMDSFYQTVTQLNVPLFIHPAPMGIDGPAGPAALARYELDIMAGFTGQETAAVATLLFSGILLRHPDLDICISHGGGAFALVYNRLKNAAHKRPWAPEAIRDGDTFDALAARLWFDIHMHDDAAVDMLASRVGTQRMVYGTNFAGWDSPKQYRPPSVDVALADNARRLLRAS
ncbi:MAG: amidohydrolase family protein [Pseudomonadota bacterium]